MNCSNEHLHHTPQLSYSQSSLSEAEAYEESVRRRAQGNGSQQAKRSTVEEDDEDALSGSGIHAYSLGGFGGEAIKHETIMASHQTSAEVEGLAPETVYLVEVRGKFWRVYINMYI